MKQITLNTIRYIAEEKQKRNMIITHALRGQILNVITKQVDQTLDELVRDGEITKNETLNDVAYKLKE